MIKYMRFYYPLLHLEYFDHWHIINLSLKHDIFPDNLKIAKVIPVFNKVLVPHAIAVVPYQSFQHKETFLRCILNQLSFYLIYEEILVPKQYGFRFGMTTVCICICIYFLHLVLNTERVDYRE